jgi:hypothetical protein
MSNAFKKYGFNLKDPGTVLTFYNSREFKVINDYKTHKTDLDELNKALNSD